MKKLLKRGIIALLFALGGPAAAAGLPTGIKWETNLTAPLYASPQAERGGVLNTSMSSYPLTFRLVGPNSNDGFAGYNRISCLDFSLVIRHPNTLEYIPMLATHWAVMPDQKTIYYKLDPDVTFADGAKVTADDYVFGYQMLLSKEIKDPFYNKYFSETIAAVEKIDDYTLKIVGAYPSWRALSDFQVPLMPKHATKLDEDWVKRDNWVPPVCVGPYQISKFKDGRFVELSRLKNWWGDKKRYLAGRYNFDTINIKVIRDEQIAFEHFKKGDLSFYVIGLAQRWAKDTNFDEINKGWIVKRRIYTRSPVGVYGIAMNLRVPIFQDKNFRKALQHLIDFDKINHNLMYDAYTRINSFFAGTEYESKDLKAYEYDPKKAEDLLVKAGFKGRGADGILVGDKGQRCSFTLTYGAATMDRHLSIIREDLQKAGVEMKLRLVDHAKAFKDGLDKNFEATILGRTANLFPDPKQYLHSDYAKTDNNNNVFAYGSPEVDKLMDIYDKDLNFKHRLKAMHRIDEIVRDEAFYVPFWTASYIRVLFWNNLGYTPEMEVTYSSEFNEAWTYWYDAAKDKTLKDAMQNKTAISGVNNVVDFDPHKILLKQKIVKKKDKA